MIDADGYRPNVGIILTDGAGHVFWARRVGRSGWQFPQGGINPDETPEQALYRELGEEIGLDPAHVELLGCTRGWLRYRLPRRYMRLDSQPLCVGQKQVWYLLRLVGRDEDVRLDATDAPEFETWRWAEYWEPVDQVIYFKRGVYRRALEELAPLAFPGATPPPRPAASKARARG